MKKYIRAIICLVYSLVKFNLIKIFHWTNFRFSIKNLISPLTEISIDRNAKLYLGRMAKMRSGSKIRVRKNGIVKIGDNTSLNHGCIFTAHEEISIGDNVQFGPNVLIYDHDHDYKLENGLKDLNYKTSAVEIGDNTWIGANVIILRGAKIGNNCVIAAGTVVYGNNKQYPDNSLIYQKKDTTIVEYEYSK